MSDFFFASSGAGTFEPTKWTRGPWGPDSQHAGPPSALIGRAIERVNDRDDMRVVRATFEILRPVPIEPLTVSAHVVRPGRSVELVEAELSAGSREIMKARAWRIRSDALDLEPTKRPHAPPLPDRDVIEHFPTGYEGYLQAMEFRFASGKFLEYGPAAAWARMRYPLVDDEPIEPLSRALILADSGNGISAELEFGKWIFINTDLTVYLHRMPEGEWVCLEAQTTVEPSGIGLSSSTLYDSSGAIGRGHQALYIAPL